MIEFILLLFPALLCTKIRETIFEEKNEIKDYIFLFAKYVLYINCIVFGIFLLSSNGGYVGYDIIFQNMTSVFKYLLFGILTAILLPVIEGYIKKYINIKIKIKVIGGKDVKKRK